MTITRRLGPTQTKMRARWVLELLDTDAGQAKGTLCAYRQGTLEVLGYCCLGIAERMRAPHSRILRPDGFDEARGYVASERAVMEARGERTFGLADSDQEIAAEWNDSADWDFAQIARMVAWITSQGHAAFEDALPHNDDGDVTNDDWDEVVVIPDDFDERAWAQGVLA
jgi:hypothetical protein